MTTISLLFVGSVLLINGLATLGRVDARAAAPINLFVAAIMAGQLIAQLRDFDAGDPPVIYAVGSLLFALTYAYFAVEDWAGTSGVGAGWFCGWAAIIAAFIAYELFEDYDDQRFGIVWMSWVLLFAAFFVLLALGREEIRMAVGWLTVIQAFTTATVPGALLITANWAETDVWLIVALQLLAPLAFLAVVGRRAAQRSATAPAAA